MFLRGIHLLIFWHTNDKYKRHSFNFLYACYIYAKQYWPFAKTIRGRRNSHENYTKKGKYEFWTSPSYSDKSIQKYKKNLSAQ